MFEKRPARGPDRDPAFICVPGASPCSLLCHVPVPVPHSRPGGGRSRADRRANGSSETTAASLSSTRPPTKRAASSISPERRTTLPDGRVRLKRAHWRATYRDPDSGQQRTIFAPTRDEVTRRRDQATADGAKPMLRSTRVGGRSTTAAFADWWIETYAPRLRRSSVDKYRERLDRLDRLADVPIGDVSPAQVADWQTWLLTTPRSNGRRLGPTTVADTRSTIVRCSSRQSISR